MIDSPAASAWRTPRRFLAQLARLRTAVTVAMLSLISAFILAGAPGSIAGPVAHNDHEMFVSDPSPRCPGEKPGMCPD